MTHALSTAPDPVEQRMRSLIVTALKRNFAIPRDKAWLTDFIAESILVELSPPAPATTSQPSSPTRAAALEPSSPTAAATQDSGKAYRCPLPCDLPEDVAQAEALWSPLLYDNLDTGVESEDVTSFCEQLLTSLRAVAEEQAEQGSAESSEGEEGACEMCERVMKLTKHHLIPREVHKEWKKRGATFDDLQFGAMLCRPCHSAVHRVADNKTLARTYNTVEKLLKVESIQRHISWARKQRVVERPQNQSSKSRARMRR